MTSQKAIRRPDAKRADQAENPFEPRSPALYIAARGWLRPWHTAFFIKQEISRMTGRDAPKAFEHPPIVGSRWWIGPVEARCVDGDDQTIFTRPIWTPEQARIIGKSLHRYVRKSAARPLGRRLLDALRNR